jgi:maltose O-acetyltransferase
MPQSALRGAARRVLARIRRDADLETSTQQGLRIGANVHVSSGTYLGSVCPWLLSIGDNVTIGSSVTIPCHDNSMKGHLGYTKVAPVAIGRRGYVGAHSIILPGVTVGDDAIIGAGSVVRADVAARVVVVGNAAEVVATTEQFAARHAARLADGPRWDEIEHQGNGVSPRLIDEMRVALDDHRAGYIP